MALAQSLNLIQNNSFSSIEEFETLLLLELKKVNSNFKEQLKFNVEKEYKLDINQILYLSCEANLVKIVHFVFNNYYARINEKIISISLHKTISLNHTQIITIFLDNINITTHIELLSESLRKAIKSKNIEMAKLLLNKGITINEPGKKIIIPDFDNDAYNIELMQLFSKKDIFCLDKKDRNFLMKASKKNSADIMNFLLQQGIDIDAVDKNNITALMIAVMYENTNAVKVLLNSNAKTNTVGTITEIIEGKVSKYRILSRKKATALVLAIENNYVLIAELIINYKVNIEEELSFAIEQNFIATVKFLLKNNNLCITNNNFSELINHSGRINNERLNALFLFEDEKINDNDNTEREEITYRISLKSMHKIK